MMSDKAIWIIEDDVQIVEIYRIVLGVRYPLRFFPDISTFNRAHTAPLPSLIIADLRLPDGSFLDYLLEDPRMMGVLAKVPCVIISSFDDVDVLRNCFACGVADYLTKPFTRSELVVKVERLLDAANSTHRKQTLVDTKKHVLKKSEDPICKLTTKEFEIFNALYRAKSAGMSRRELQSAIWKGVIVSSKALDVHLFNLRKKLDEMDMKIHFFPPDQYILSGDRVNEQPLAQANVSDLNTGVSSPKSESQPSL